MTYVGAVREVQALAEGSALMGLHQAIGHKIRPMQDTISGDCMENAFLKLRQSRYNPNLRNPLAWQFLSFQYNEVFPMENKGLQKHHGHLWIHIKVTNSVWNGNAWCNGAKERGKEANWPPRELKIEAKFQENNTPWLSTEIEARALYIRVVSMIM